MQVLRNHLVLFLPLLPALLGACGWRELTAEEYNEAWMLNRDAPSLPKFPFYSGHYHHCVFGNIPDGECCIHEIERRRADELILRGDPAHASIVPKAGESAYDLARCARRASILGYIIGLEGWPDGLNHWKEPLDPARAIAVVGERMVAPFVIGWKVGREEAELGPRWVREQRKQRMKAEAALRGRE